MKLSCAVVCAAFHLATAHTVFTTLFINDVDQGDGVCVRMPMTANNATSPVVGTPLSIETACGNGGNIYVNRTCPAPAGAKLTFQFREIPDNVTGGSLDTSHKGPCAVYMKNISDPMQPGHGGSWFKIWDEGYDTNTSKWCTEKRIMDTNGFLSVRIPGGLPGGYYLVRPELISLHQADKDPPDPQFCTGCAQIFLSPSSFGRNGVLPKETVSIPGWIAPDDPGLRYNIYTMNETYQMPGPMPYPSGLRNSVLVQNNLHQEFGLLPSDVVVTNGNWWASELASYNTSDGCSNASKSCYSQLDACYATAQPTGNTGCRLWEQKCDGIQSACNANNFIGPPDAGKSMIIVQENPYPIPYAAVWTTGVYSGHYNSAIDSNTAISITLLPTVTGGSQTTQRSISPTTTVLKNAASSVMAFTPVSKLASRALAFLKGLVQKPVVSEHLDGAPSKVQLRASRLKNLTITIVNNATHPASHINNVTITIANDLTNPRTRMKPLPPVATPSSLDVCAAVGISSHGSRCGIAQTIVSTPSLSPSKSAPRNVIVSHPSSLPKTSLSSSPEPALVGETTIVSTVTSVIEVTISSTWTSWIDHAPSGSLTGGIFAVNTVSEGPDFDPATSPVAVVSSLTTLHILPTSVTASSKSAMSTFLEAAGPLAVGLPLLQSSTSRLVASSTATVIAPTVSSSASMSNPPSNSPTSIKSSATSKSTMPSSAEDTDAITITIIAGTDHNVNPKGRAATTNATPQPSELHSLTSPPRRGVEHLKRRLPNFRGVHHVHNRKKGGRKTWE